MANKTLSAHDVASIGQAVAMGLNAPWNACTVFAQYDVNFGTVHYRIWWGANERAPHLSDGSYIQAARVYDENYPADGTSMLLHEKDLGFMHAQDVADLFRKVIKAELHHRAALRKAG